MDEENEEEFSLPSASIESDDHSDVDPFEELGIGSPANKSSTEDNGQLVVVARNPGEVKLVSGSDRTLYDGFQLAPNNSPPRSLFDESTWLVWLILLGGVAALLPALQHTFPLLWSRRKSDEEE